MLVIAARSLIFTLPLTTLLLVAGLWLGRQPGTQPGPFILNTRDIYNTQAAIYALDAPTGLMRPVVRYDQSFVGATAGWSWPVFSGDGRHVAYVRRERGRQWIGVSDSARWQPLEFPAAIPPSTQDVRLTWLPSNRALVISYTRNDVDSPVKHYNVLVGRQLLDLSGPPDSARLVDWPYVCDALFLATRETRPTPALGCSSHPELTGAHFPIGVLYDFETGTWADFGHAALREVAPLDDLLYPNWAYSPVGGLAYFHRSAQAFPTLNWIAPGSGDVVALRTGAIFQPRFVWSPDGSRLLIEQADPRVWAVFDVGRNQEIARFGPFDIDVNIGYQWYNGSDHVAYVVLPAGRQPESLHVRSVDGGDQWTLFISRHLTDIAWLRP